MGRTKKKSLKINKKFNEVVKGKLYFHDSIIYILQLDLYYDY